MITQEGWMDLRALARQGDNFSQIGALALTFRTLFRSSEAMLAAPPEKRGGRTLHGSWHML